MATFNGDPKKGSTDNAKEVAKQRIDLINQFHKENEIPYTFGINDKEKREKYNEFLKTLNEEQLDKTGYYNLTDDEKAFVNEAVEKEKKYQYNIGVLNDINNFFKDSANSWGFGSTVGALVADVGSDFGIENDRISYTESGGSWYNKKGELKQKGLRIDNLENFKKKYPYLSNDQFGVLGNFKSNKFIGTEKNDKRIDNFKLAKLIQTSLNEIGETGAIPMEQIPQLFAPDSKGVYNQKGKDHNQNGKLPDINVKNGRDGKTIGGILQEAPFLNRNGNTYDQNGNVSSIFVNTPNSDDNSFNDKPSGSGSQFGENISVGGSTSNGSSSNQSKETKPQEIYIETSNSPLNGISTSDFDDMYEPDEVGERYDEKPVEWEREGVPWDDLARVAVGVIGGASAASKKTPRMNLQLDTWFNDYVSNMKRLSEQGLSPQEEGYAKGKLKEAYLLGKENIINSSNGNRNIVLGNLSRLDAQFQEGLMQIANADAQKRLQAGEAYGEAMKYIQDLNFQNKLQNSERDYKEALMTKEAGAKLMAGSFQALMDTIQSQKDNAPGGIMHAYKNQTYMNTFGWSPYIKSGPGSKEDFVKRYNQGIANQEELNRQKTEAKGYMESLGLNDHEKKALAHYMTQEGKSPYQLYKDFSQGKYTPEDIYAMYPETEVRRLGGDIARSNLLGNISDALNASKQEVTDEPIEDDVQLNQEQDSFYDNISNNPGFMEFMNKQKTKVGSMLFPNKSNPYDAKNDKLDVAKKWFINDYNKNMV